MDVFGLDNPFGPNNREPLLCNWVLNTNTKIRVKVLGPLVLWQIGPVNIVGHFKVTRAAGMLGSAPVLFGPLWWQHIIRFSCFSLSPGLGRYVDTVRTIQLTMHKLPDSTAIQFNSIQFTNQIPKLSN